MTRNPLAATSLRGRLREQPNRSLRCVVGGHRAGRGGEPRRRAHRDDAAPAARSHRADRRLHDEEDAADVDRHQPVVLRRLDLGERRAQTRLRRSRRPCRAGSRRPTAATTARTCSTSVTSSSTARAEPPAARSSSAQLPPRGRRGRRRRRRRRGLRARARSPGRCPCAPPTTREPRGGSADVGGTVDVDRRPAQMPAAAGREERDQLGDLLGRAPSRPSRARR